MYIRYLFMYYNHRYLLIRFVASYVRKDNYLLWGVASCNKFFIVHSFTEILSEFDCVETTLFFAAQRINK